MTKNQKRRLRKRVARALRGYPPSHALVYAANAPIKRLRKFVGRFGRLNRDGLEDDFLDYVIDQGIAKHRRTRD